MDCVPRRLNCAKEPRAARLATTVKRIERERSKRNRAAADLVARALPVLDNLRRAVDTEASVEASESDEDFGISLNGVDLIHKQLSGVLEALGVKPVLAWASHSIHMFTRL
jgi:molecular chaperone GrpE (heat shock protein)